MNSCRGCKIIYDLHCNGELVRVGSGDPLRSDHSGLMFHYCVLVLGDPLVLGLFLRLPLPDLVVSFAVLASSRSEASPSRALFLNLASLLPAPPSRPAPSRWRPLVGPPHCTWPPPCHINCLDWLLHDCRHRVSSMYLAPSLPAPSSQPAPARWPPPVGPPPCHYDLPPPCQLGRLRQLLLDGLLQ